eukprot:2529632-Prymnesium_polylepis.3
MAKAVFPGQTRLLLTESKLQEEREADVQKLIKGQQPKKRWPEEYTTTELKLQAVERGIKRPRTGWPTCCPPSGRRDDIIHALSRTTMPAVPSAAEAAAEGFAEWLSESLQEAAGSSADPMVVDEGPVAEPSVATASTNIEAAHEPSGEQMGTDLPCEEQVDEETRARVLASKPGSTAAFKRVNKAFEVLKDEEKRRLYNMCLGSGGSHEETELAAHLMKEARAELAQFRANQLSAAKRVVQELPAVVLQLSDSRWATRKEALLHLGELPGDSILEHVGRVRACLDDPSAAVRAQVVRTLLKLIEYCSDEAASEREAATVLSMLEDSSDGVRNAVIGGAFSMGWMLVPHVMAVVLRLEHSDSNVRHAVVKVLGALDPSLLAHHATALAAKLMDEDRDVRIAVVETLGKLDRSVLAQHATTLIAKLEDEYWAVRSAVVCTLGKLEPPVLAQHVAALAAKLEDPYLGVRLAVVKVLEGMKLEGAALAAMDKARQELLVAREGRGSVSDAACAESKLHKGPPGANLFIVRKKPPRGQRDDLNDAQLRDAFSCFGNLLRAESVLEKGTGISKGFGFISFATVEEADAAMAAMDGTMIGGRKIKIEKRE